MQVISIEGDTRVGPAYALFGFFGWLTSRTNPIGPFGKNHDMTDLWVMFYRFAGHEKWDWESEESNSVREFLAWLGHQEESMGPFSCKESTADLNYNLWKWCEHKRYDLGSEREAIRATLALQPYPSY